MKLIFPLFAAMLALYSCGPRIDAKSAAAETAKADSLRRIADKERTEKERQALINEIPELIRAFDAAKYTGKPYEIAAGGSDLAAIAMRVVQAELDSVPGAVSWRAELQAKQATAFPALRKAWVESMDQILWEDNINVKAVNKDASVIKFIGGAYASNKNIKETQEKMAEQMRLLRIKQVRYLWIPSDDEYQYYKLNTPSDREL